MTCRILVDGPGTVLVVRMTPRWRSAIAVMEHVLRGKCMRVNKMSVVSNMILYRNSCVGIDLIRIRMNAPNGVFGSMNRLRLSIDRARKIGISRGIEVVIHSAILIPR